MIRFSRSWPLVGVIILALLATAGSATAQMNSFYGKTTIKTPERTDAGDWEGTWFFLSKVHRMVLWMRNQNGVPQIKFRFQGQGVNAQNFETDWNAVGEINVKGRTGVFAMEFDQRDENTISGRWAWDVVQNDAVLTDKAEFIMFRGGEGRQMIWKIQNEPRKTEARSAIKPGSGLLVWTFRKASRRVVLWSEIPF